MLVVRRSAPYESRRGASCNESLKQSRNQSIVNFLRVGFVFGILHEQPFLSQEPGYLDRVQQRKDTEIPDMRVEDNESSMKENVAHVDWVSNQTVGSGDADTSIRGNDSKATAKCNL